jgi:SPP1 family predicted phage head-tail adaptor
MEAGELRHRITIQSKTISSDSIGNQTTAWSDFITVWAKKEEKSGREYLKASQPNIERTVIFTIRYTSEIDESMQISYGDKVYDIQAILDTEGRKRSLTLVCREPDQAREVV